jgi:hypothetical protein
MADNGQYRVYKNGQPGDWKPVPDHTPAAPGGTNTDTGKTETVDEAVDRMSGDDTNMPTAGRSAQSTDAQNQY